MVTVTIPHPREDAKIVVKAALEDCSGIKTYHDRGARIVGKTGASIGLIKSSYGEKVIVEIPQDQTSGTKTMVSITGEKEVSTNIGANPDKYVSQLTRKINDIKRKPTGLILDVLEENGISENSKEVSHKTDQAGGGWVMAVIVGFIFFMFFMMIMI